MGCKLTKNIISQFVQITEILTCHSNIKFNKDVYNVINKSCDDEQLLCICLNDDVIVTIDYTGVTEEEINTEEWFAYLEEISKEFVRTL